MRDATYVIVALALCMIAAVFMMHTTTKQPTSISMFELKEFAHVPLEIRHVLRKSMIPDQALSKQKWASLNPVQKQVLIDQISSMFQQQQQQQPPSVVPEDPPVLLAPPHPPVVDEDGFKRGFLLTESKKSHTKNKKKDKAETLVQVVASPEEPASGGDAAAATGGFLGNDD